MKLYGLEEEECADYVRHASEERRFADWINEKPGDFGLIVAEGFEQRSLGVLRKLSERGVKIRKVVIGRYTKNAQLNAPYRARFEKFAKQVSSEPYSVIQNGDDGKWVCEAAKLINAERLLLDISGISNSAMFGALDAVFSCERQVSVGYSDALEYWPRKRDWENLQRRVAGGEALSREADKMPWLQGYQHFVRLVPGHEGYDSAGNSRALLAFLPFKSARLASVLSAEDYSAFLFLALKPRFPENLWRLDALKRINAPIIKDWPVVDIGAFDYRSTVLTIADLLFRDGSLLENYDLHFAVMGSKLQTLGCWVLSSIVRSIAIVTSSPAQYYPKAFSKGIGESWCINLRKPPTLFAPQSQG